MRDNITQGVLAYKFPISILMRTHDQHWSQKNKKKHKKICTNLRFCHQATEFEKTSKISGHTKNLKVKNTKMLKVMLKC